LVEDHEHLDQEKPSMKIVGCDLHPQWQQIAVFDVEAGEISERKLINSDGDAERFYLALEAPSLVGVEACGNSQWFIELLERLGYQVWIGDAAQIHASDMHKQKTDRRDEGTFSGCFWKTDSRSCGCRRPSSGIFASC
jgi:transposase